MFISGATLADIFLVFCKTGQQEVSAFVIEKGTEGLSFGKEERKMGWKCQPTTLVNF